MKFDISKPHCYYFNEICKIPHGSYNEKALSDYIVQFAKDLGLKWKQDEMWNVIVYKDKNGDYSDESLILQAHIDMVCEKNKSTVHDFEKDPIKLYVDEEGWLHADGTTLGADDGHGCAYMMAILADKEMKHPALECVFTVQEEVGLCGSMIIKKEDLKSNRMVSLDGGGEVTTSLCSAAGARVKLIKTIETKVNTKPAYTLSVLGLLGGHSGGEIHKEKGNSNKLLVRILMELKLAGCDVELGFIEGGLKANAIPREATCIFASDTA
ncbi:MAG: M20/M25/M40 family metallo-hydrolase, partial [Erysipelotrichaceae bacterium]